MASDQISIKIQSTYDPKGTQAAIDWINKYKQALGGATKAPTIPDPFRETTKSAPKAQQSILAVARAQASLQQSSGNAAGGIKILKGALEQVDQSSVAAIRAMKQVVDMENRLSSAKGPTVLPRTIDGLSGSALRAVQAIGAITVALAGLNSAAQAIGGVADYEQSMNVLQATAGATDDQMHAVAETAKALGADLDLPATSAAGAAQAMDALVRQGLSLDDAMSAAKGTLQLAAAGMISEKEAAQYTAAALNQFKLSGDRAVAVADLLAASVGSAGSEVGQTGQAIQQAGASFAAANLSVTDLVVSIDLMSKAGIKGSDAGTSLKTMLQRLQSPTAEAKSEMQALGISVYDAQGKMRPYRDIIENVTSSLSGLSEQRRGDAINTIFGSDAQRAANIVLAGGTEAYDKMREAVSKNGAAGNLAQSQMQGLNGAVKGLQSQVETLALNGIEPLLPLMTEMVTAASELAGSLQGDVGPAAATLAEGIRNLGGFIRDYAIPTIIALSVASIGYATVTLPTLTTSLGAATTAFLANNAAALATTSVYALVGIAIAGVYKAYQDLQGLINTEKSTFLTQQKGWVDSTAALERYAQASGDAKAKLAPFAKTLTDMQAMINHEMDQYAGKEANWRLLGDASGFTRAQLDKEAASITAHIKGLEQASAGYTKVEQAASATNNALADQRWGEITAGMAGTGQIAQLTADEIAAIGKEIETLTDKGVKSAESIATAQAGFLAGYEQRHADHEAKLTQLTTEQGQARTKAQKESIAERIQAENDGFAEQEQAAAESYARQIAAEQEALGQQLLAYVDTQVAMGKLSADAADALTAKISQEFGVTESQASQTFSAMKQSIDDYASGATSSADTVVNSIRAQEDAASALKSKYDTLVGQYTAQVLTEMAGRPPEEIRKALEAIPGKVYSEVYVTTHERTVNDSAPRSRQRQGGSVSGLAGGGVARGMTLVGEKGGEIAVGRDGKAYIVGANGPEVRKFDEPTTIIPADESRALIKNGMADGGDLLGGASTARPKTGAGSRGGDTPYDKLINVAENAGQKLAKIDQDLQQKLIDIDTKAAEQRAQVARQLNEDIASSMADLGVEMETNDFEKYRKGANKKDFAAREAEEKAYYERLKGLQDAARQEAVNGDAQLAADKLKIREEQLNRDRQITEKYNAVRAQASKKDQAALKKEYDEAIAASQNAADTKVAIAEADAQQRSQAVDKQKQDAITSAQDERIGVLTEAQQQAADIKGVTDAQRATVIQNANAARDGAIQAAKETRDGVNQAYSEIKPPVLAPPSGGATPTAPSGTSAAAGGGSFMSNQPTWLLVGDNPGGKEKVTVEPISGKGKTRVGKGMVAMAGGGSLQVNSVSGEAGVARGSLTVDVAIAETGRTLQSMTRYINHITALADFVDKVIALRAALKTPPPPLDPNAVAQLAKDTQVTALTFAKYVVGGAQLQANAMKGYMELAGQITDIISKTVQLEQALVEPRSPISEEMARDLARETQSVAAALGAVIIPTSKANAESMQLFLESTSAAVDTILKILDLKQGLQDRALYPVDPTLIKWLAQAAREVAQVAERELAPLADIGSEALQNAAAAVGASVDTVMKILDLKKGLQDRALYPVDPTLIKWLAQAARDVTRIVQREMIPVTQEQTDALARLSDATSSSVGILKDIIDLKKELQERALYPVDPDVVQGLAVDANRVTQIVQSNLLPTSQEQADQLGQWADAVGSSVGVIKDVTSLTRAMFTDYQSPSNSDIQRIADDANRVVQQIAKAAATYDTKGLDAAKLFADAAGGTFSAFKDGLLFFDALRSGDFTLDTGALAQFEKSTAATLDVARRLSAQAATIPAQNLNALQNTVSAIGATAETMIKLTAVPFGDLPNVAQQFGGVGIGGGGNTTIYNSFSISGVSDPNMVVNMVIQRLGNQFSSRK